MRHRVDTLPRIQPRMVTSFVILTGVGVRRREMCIQPGSMRAPDTSLGSQLTGHCLLFSTDSREVKVGEYNAVADTLEIINDTIRFQGKACRLPEGHHA